MLVNVIVANILGFIMFVMSIIIGVSQLFTIFKTKNTSGTSITTYILFIICASISVSWGYVYFMAHMSSWWNNADNIPLSICQLSSIWIISNYILQLFGSMSLIVIKARHIRLARKYHVNELQLSKILLSKIKSKKEQYLPLVILLASLFTLTIILAVVLMIFTNPSINPSIISPDEGEWTPIIITLSVIAAALWESINWPQFIKCLKNKDTSGISLNWAIFMPICCLFSFSYSLAIAFVLGEFTFDTIGALIFNGIVVNVGILIIKLINHKRAKHLKISEIEYTRKYLHKKQKRA